MTAPSRLKSALELLVVLLFAFFIRLLVLVWSSSRRNFKAGNDEKREADGVSSGAISQKDDSPPSDPRLPISQGSACCPHIFGLLERARRDER